MQRSYALSLVMVCLLSSSVMAASISVVPIYQEVGQGQTFTVNLVGSVSGAPNDRNFYNWSLDVMWDASVIMLTNIFEGPFLGSGGAPTFLGFGVGSDIPNGFLDNLSGTILGLLPGVVGTGVLATLEFLAIGPVDSYSAIQLLPTNFDPQGNPYLGLDDLGERLYGETPGGRVRIIPEPTSMLLLSAGAAAMVLRRKKTQA